MSEEKTYEVARTNTCQAPYIRTILHRALEIPGAFSSTENVNNARHMKFEDGLPDGENWALTFSQLRTLAIVVQWREAKHSDGILPESSTESARVAHREIRQAIKAAYREACHDRGITWM